MKPAYLCVAALFCVACTEEISVNTGEHTSHIAIIAMFNNEYKQHSVSVTQSVAYFSDDEPPVLTDQEIDRIVLTGGNISEMLFNYDANRQEFLSAQKFSIRTNTDYTLRVVLRDGTEFIAVDHAPDSIWLRYARLQIINGTDTGRYRPTFLVSGAVERSDLRNIHMRVSHIHNGKKIAEKLSQMAAGEIPDGASYGVNPTSAPFLSSVGAGWFVHDTNGTKMVDTQWYAPRDTVGVQMHTISEALYRFVHSVRSESGSSGNPLFGGIPANLETNFAGKNVTGVFGLYITGAPYDVVLPLNTKTFDYDKSRWITYVGGDSIVAAIKDGRAVYEYPPALQGQEYFSGMNIVDGERKFSAQVGGSERQFYIKDYFEFWELPDNHGLPLRKWHLSTKSQREEQIASILEIF